MLVDNTKIIKCIEKSIEAKLAAKKEILSNLQQNGEPFYPPFLECFDITWKEEPIERLKQILLLPILILLCVVLVLSTPLIYLVHLWDVRKKTNKLEKEVHSENHIDSKTIYHEIDSLISLWQLYGLNEFDFSKEEMFDLLRDWLEILYGKEIVGSLNLEKRLINIQEEQQKANTPYYDGIPDASHYNFISPVEHLIIDLSEEFTEHE